MSRNLWNKAAWVLLAGAVAVLNSSEPAGDACSIADLDGDCDVDLADYMVFQQEFSGETSFRLVGEDWDVFYLRNTDQEWAYAGSWRFYANGTMNPNSQDSDHLSFRFYEFDGNAVVLDGLSPQTDDPVGCPPPSIINTVVTFVTADRMEGSKVCTTDARQLESYLVLRRF